MSRREAARTAFTLVELLVVIGIIAILIGILLPTLKRARQQANTIACAGQLRNVMQGVLIYASENRGTMPFSFAWRRAAVSPGGYMTGSPQVGVVNTNFGALNGYPWAAGFHYSKYVSDQATKDTSGGYFPLTAAQVPMKLSKVFVCPEVRVNDYYSGSINSYSFNPVILVNQPFEVFPNGALSNYRGGVFVSTYTWSPSPLPSPQGNTGGTSSPVGPARLSQLYADNAVLWDTNVVDGTIAANAFTPANVFGGFGMSGIDGGQMAEPQKAWQRYRNANAYPLTEPWERPDKPILFPTKAVEKTSRFRWPWVNADPFNGFLVFPDNVGNARFRHMGDTVCNVAFADGSVRSLKININRVAYRNKLGEENADSDFLRQYLQIKKPGGLPSPQQEQEP